MIQFLSALLIDSQQVAILSDSWQRITDYVVYMPMDCSYDGVQNISRWEAYIVPVAYPYSNAEQNRAENIANSSLEMPGVGYIDDVLSARIRRQGCVPLEENLFIEIFP